MDRLDAMQVLLTVVDEGSLSAGSRKLRTPLPSVSRKVAELERHLGTRLLIRTSRNVQLTDAGRDYIDSARHIVAELKEAEVRASGEYQVPRGELTIAATLQLGRAVVAPLTYEFLEEYPEISLNLRLIDRAVDLVDEQIDVAVRVGNLEDSSLYATKVGEGRIITCASSAYLERMGRPARPEDLANHDAVIFTRMNEATWVYWRDGKRFEGLPRLRVRVNSPVSAIDATIRGLGLTRAFNFMIDDKLRDGNLVRILDEYDGGSLPLHLVYARQGMLPVKIRAFLDWMAPRLRERLQTCAATGGGLIFSEMPNS
jgi:DNA-binding transcriptional LysR family regulator